MAHGTAHQVNRLRQCPKAFRGGGSHGDKTVLRLSRDNTTTTDSKMEEPYLQGVPLRPPESKEEGNPPKLKCELCGRVNFAYKFKRSKRFCSMACAKRYNVDCTKRVGLFHPNRSKLQKPGSPPHGRRRTCKGTLPALSKDSKKQLNHSQEDSSRCSDNSSYEEPPP
ncbi:PREDICTED: polyhomeotic-like protein 2, partial [Eurypyga helias]|uniref:polyhomeotic-like protein 2 n=1 Tax=Eurypyga helias TaxID=54383 RepID=UPI0005291AFE